MNHSLPSRELLQLQSDWLSEARARILRLAEIARRKCVLDLGAGYGWITQELRRRTSGTVIAFDRSLQAISSLQPCVNGRAEALPFCNQSFDFVFSQNVMLWVREPEEVIGQVKRVLATRGVWVLIEPDYSGMIEHPHDVESAFLWIAALKRCGADPKIGRKLPLLLTGADFQVRTELLPRLEEPRLERFDFLSDLDLTKEEQTQLKRIKSVSQQLTPGGHISHLPYFMMIAERP